MQGVEAQLRLRRRSACTTSRSSLKNKSSRSSARKWSTLKRLKWHTSKPKNTKENCSNEPKMEMQVSSIKLISAQLENCSIELELAWMAIPVLVMQALQLESITRALVSITLCLEGTIQPWLWMKLSVPRTRSVLLRKPKSKKWRKISSELNKKTKTCKMPKRRSNADFKPWRKLWPNEMSRYSRKRWNRRRFRMD